MSKEDRELKVTDKRMFTSEGDLREEYRFLDDKATGAADVPPPPPAAAAQAVPAASAPAEPAGPAAPWPGAEPPVRLEIPGSPPGLGASFYDLLTVLAEPVAIYLGDIELPDGQSAENLEAARFHIDLLDVLREKTAGNLGAQETAYLEDLLYRSRLRYVQKRG